MQLGLAVTDAELAFIRSGALKALSGWADAGRSELQAVEDFKICLAASGQDDLARRFDQWAYLSAPGCEARNVAFFLFTCLAGVNSQAQLPQELFYLRSKSIGMARKWTEEPLTLMPPELEDDELRALHECLGDAAGFLSSYFAYGRHVVLLEGAVREAGNDKKLLIETFRKWLHLHKGEDWHLPSWLEAQ